MANHSNILAWEIPRTEEPGGPQSTRSQRVGHDRPHTHTQDLDIQVVCWKMPKVTLLLVNILFKMLSNSKNKSKNYTRAQILGLPW